MMNSLFKPTKGFQRVHEDGKLLIAEKSINIYNVNNFVIFLLLFKSSVNKNSEIAFLFSQI